MCAEIKNYKEYIFLHGAKRVSWEGIQTKTNFYFRERTFTFRDRREEGQLSAERSEARQSFRPEIEERESCLEEKNVRLKL